MILFKNGRETQRLVGYMPKEKVLQLLNPHLSDSSTSAA
jgi:thioredoxin-like negative regulator of GroEL